MADVSEKSEKKRRTKKAAKVEKINIGEQIRALAAERGISEELVMQTLEASIKAAYKKEYRTDENCIVRFSDDLSELNVYQRKVVVDGVYDPNLEIELEEALEYSSEAEVGDEIDIEIDPKNFKRYAVTQGKQKAHQDLSETSRDSLMKEYKSKIGEVIIGYIQRESNGNFYLDLGKENKVEGELPKKYQSLREVYEKNDRIKALIVDIKPTNSGVKLVLSRTDSKLVQNFLEAEVPEIADKTIEIKKIVREAGYRTKIAVTTNNPDVDPVGACVGKNGTRITNVIQQLEGEKIDILNYDEDPHKFIANALSPAEVLRVVILDSAKREALAVVSDEQFSVAIGKLGQNVRLANKLCDWNIDVKTEAQVAEMDLTEVAETDTRRAAEELFADNGSGESDYEEITSVSQLPNVDIRVVGILMDAGLDDISAFLDAVDNGSILNVEGITQADVDSINKIINDNAEIEEEQAEDKTDAPAAEETEAEEDEYFCPDCGAKITLDMTRCPNCGVELVFEEE